MSNVFDDDFDDRFDDDNPSHTSVTMKLAIIQQRCSDLIKESDGESDEHCGGLALAEDEPEPAADDANPYDPYGRG